MKISRQEREIMPLKVLSEFPQHVLPLPCNVCNNVTSLWLDQSIIDTAVGQQDMCLSAYVVVVVVWSFIKQQSLGAEGVKVKGGQFGCW